MTVKDIKITNFKSMYGVHYFNFLDLEGMVKLSGPVGSGKTSIAEAILYGLFGSVKDHNNPNLISWGEAIAEVEMNIICKDKEIHIKRNTREPLEITINGKAVTSSNKKDMQNILEEYYDVSRIGIEKCAIIAFSQFNSIAKMTPADTKSFLDNIFGFKTFTEFSDKITIERKEQVAESSRLLAVLEDTKKQVEYLKQKKELQQIELSKTFDTETLNKNREDYINTGKILKEELTELQTNMNNTVNDYTKQLTEFALLGKKEKEYYEKFSSGVCPTCGHEVDKQSIEDCHNRMLDYANKWKTVNQQKNDYISKQQPLINEKNNQINDFRNKIFDIDSKLKEQLNSIKILSENYDSLIKEYSDKITELESQLSYSDIEVGQWNDMTELFSKTLRYNLLDTLIPHINRSVQHYLDKFDQSYQVKFDQEFKCHIYSDTIGNEITYADLSTGQKKSLDLTIIFGVLEHLVSSVNINILFLDELVANLSKDLRDIVLTTISKSFGKDKTVFIVSHAEIADDLFDHKLRASLIPKKINVGKKKGREAGEYIVNCSKYEQIF